ncbi:rhomboid family intramembrane serine protease [Leptolyngbya sp. BC1307]|uniref:rhomboid family intramembrane serine protease n=1 Tax=Leptolyngbya sp. BC1307 TaxID=2029589 RepID=UPI001F0A5CE9|nr:rhomboid family intramembrane serine protease [Leptolyngbya sp. BC1307]
MLCLILGGIILSLYSTNPDWYSQAAVLRDSVILTWMVSLLNLAVGNGLGRLLGIRPRQLIGLLGIVFSPLLHRSLGHLLANTIPFLVLGWLVLLQGRLQGQSDFYAVTVTILLIGGLGTWLFGRDAIHLGASGLIFGYIGFLLINGYAEATLLTIGFALVVFLMYGNQLWSMLPSSNETTISWEGHLFGFAGGIVAGVRPDWLETIGAALNNLIQQLSVL